LNFRLHIGMANHLGGYQSSAVKAALSKSSLSDNEFKTVLQKVFRELNIRFSSVGAALRTLNIESDGEVPRGQVAKLFEYAGVNIRMADRFCNRIVGVDRETIHVDQLRGLLDPEASSATSSRRSSYDGASNQQNEMQQIARSLKRVHISNDKKANNDVIINLEKLGLAAFRRHGCLRVAFKAVDRGRTGWCSRREIRNFYKMYGFDDRHADSFFDKMLDDHPSADAISYDEFISVFKPYFHEEEFLDQLGPHTRQGTCRAADVAKYGSEDRKQELPDDLRIIINNVCHSVSQKHNSLHLAFRRFDGNHDGTVSRDEVRKFFRNHGYPSANLADQFFDYLDADRIGFIDFSEFQSYFGTFVWAPGEPGMNDPYGGISSYHAGHGHGLAQMKYAYDDTF